jgi:P27 family predicted phage terminase small subunit
MKRARGTLRPCRESPTPPKGTPGIPDPPPGLDAQERAAWDEFAERLSLMQVLQREQAGVLELLAKAQVRYRRLSARVREEGEVLADETGRLYRNPTVVSFERAFAEYRRLLAEVGLTPAAASRVRAETEQAASDGDANARRFFGLVHGERRRP